MPLFFSEFFKLRVFLVSRIGAAVMAQADRRPDCGKKRYRQEANTSDLLIDAPVPESDQFRGFSSPVFIAGLIAFCLATISI
jgi:hypothetical protein